jgi:hypothetical protein
VSEVPIPLGKPPLFEVEVQKRPDILIDIKNKTHFYPPGSFLQQKSGQREYTRQFCSFELTFMYIVDVVGVPIYVVQKGKEHFLALGGASSQ